MSATARPDLGAWSGTDVTVSGVLHRLALLRAEAGPAVQRTAVMTHVAWVPPGWEEAALDTLSGLQERHPSRTTVLLPDPDAADGLDADLALRCFSVPGQEGTVCSEVLILRLRGNRTKAPASIALPLLIPDLRAFLRWRGQPPFGDGAFEQLVDVVDRLIVDSTEWEDLPAAYRSLTPVFERAAVSDIAWQRTERWRGQLASLWPAIATVRAIRVRGTAAQAHLLAGWLRSRLQREVDGAKGRLERRRLDGDPDGVEPSV